MIAATPLRANSRRMCRYTTLLFPRFLNHLVSADTNSPRICTFHTTLSRAVSAHTRPFPLTHFVSAHTRTREYPRLKSQTHGFSALTHSGRRHNPSAGFSFAPLRAFAPLRVRRGGRETPEVAFDPKPQIRKFYRIDPQALRNSILRNSHIPQGLEIPPGGGAIFVFKNR